MQINYLLQFKGWRHASTADTQPSEGVVLKLVLGPDSGRQSSANEYNSTGPAEECCSVAHPNYPPIGRRFLRKRLIEWVATEGFQCFFGRRSSSLAQTQATQPHCQHL